MELNLTQEEINRNILAAYDSVNLIVNLQAKEMLTEEEINRLSINQEHLQIMLNKPWFSSALTEIQLDEITSASLK